MGKTDKYLETPVGRASFNVLKMAREGLRFKLSTALHNAIRQKMATTYEGIRVKYNGSFQIVDLTVRPLTEAKTTGGFFLILFEEKSGHEKPPVEKGKKATSKDETDPVVDSLERELETSKEELQSTNEELVTVNTELQNKVDELSQVNNDINNLLASTDIGTIFLDTTLSIKRFTPAMTKIFNLIKTDIDRPISDITSKIKYGQLKNDSQEVLDTLICKEANVRSESGEWFSMRISPYRTTENIIDGVVITFVDIYSMILFRLHDL